MIRHSFPDLKWKQQMSKTAFDKKANADVIRWPDVSLNAKTKTCYRPNIKGPLSMFMNVSGTSYVEGQEARARIDERHFFLTNHAEEYMLKIDSEKEVETFNIHFGNADILLANRALTGQVVQSWEGSLSFEDRPGFFSRLYKKDDWVRQQVALIKSCDHDGSLDKLGYQEALAHLVGYLVKSQHDLKQRAEAINVAKKSTRQELFKRLNLAVDYMHSHFEQNLSLDELARVAAMSKYHFLRLFREAFQRTPHQFLMEVRLEFAKWQLQKSALPIAQVASNAGFHTPAVFSRTFHKHVGLSPKNYVKEVGTQKLAILVNS